MRFSHALAAVAALAGGVRAQSNTPTPQPAAMPGVTVGAMPKGSGVAPVGAPIPKAAPQAGARVGGGQLPGTIPQFGPGAGNKPVTPPGQVVDLKNVIAPYPNMPKEKTFWEKLEERYFGLFAPDPLPRAPNFTPGLVRRNRERREERLQRQWWE